MASAAAEGISLKAVPWLRLLVLVLACTCLSLADASDAGDEAPFLSFDIGERYLKCILRDQKGNLVPLQFEGKRVLQTIVTFHQGIPLFGTTAQDLSLEMPRESFSGLIGLLGKKDYAELLKFHIDSFVSKRLERNETQETILFRTLDASFPVEQLLALILAKVKREAEEQIGSQISHAYFSVPTHIDPTAIRALVDAARMSGFDELDLIPESHSLAAGLLKKYPNKLGETLILFDYGAGSSKAFRVKTTKSGADLLQVEEESVERNVGGNALDACLGKRILAELTKDAEQPDVSEATEAKILDSARELKEKLTETLEANAQGIHSTLKVTRREFETECREFLQKALNPVARVLAQPSGVNSLLLLGQGSRIQKIQGFVKQQLKGLTIKAEVVAPDNLAALGSPFVAKEVAPCWGGPLTNFQQEGRRRVEELFLRA